MCEGKINKTQSQNIFHCQTQLQRVNIYYKSVFVKALRIIVEGIIWKWKHKFPFSKPNRKLSTRVKKGPVQSLLPNADVTISVANAWRCILCIHALIRRVDMALILLTFHLTKNSIVFWLQRYIQCFFMHCEFLGDSMPWKILRDDLTCLRNNMKGA